MYIKVLSVSSLNGYVKKILDNDFILNNVSVKGEISNFKLHNNGHLYFSLKDENSKINCVMFRNYTENMNFLPENGMKVIIKGRISVYEKDGSYQLYCKEMNLDGIGELYLAFERLRQNLEMEGIFKIEHKKAIPEFPQKIGVITSPTGAAVRDIINVAKRRNPGINILIYPSLVQGVNASKEIIKGIEYFNSKKDIDIILLARGGGSIEELWAFNEAELAYAIYESKKPIITGVGHETDTTIVDYVSDRRAPTPSAAAEIAIPNILDLKYKLETYKNGLTISMKRNIKNKYEHLILMNKNLNMNTPINYIKNQHNKLEKLRTILNLKTKARIDREKDYLSKNYAVLSANNPLNILNKGYALIQDKNNHIISGIETLKKTAEINIVLKDGKIRAALECKEE